MRFLTKEYDRYKLLTKDEKELYLSNIKSNPKWCILIQLPLYMLSVFSMIFFYSAINLNQLSVALKALTAFLFIILMLMSINIIFVIGETLIIKAVLKGRK